MITVEQTAVSHRIHFPARILRILATYHIFIETSPNVFKNNRLSSIMDTMKSVEEIKAKYVSSLNKWALNLNMHKIDQKKSTLELSEWRH